MRQTRTLAFIALLSVAAGCADSGPLSPERLNGRWAKPDEVPGSSFAWTLAVDGSRVTGTGTWSGEACCGGTIAVAGDVTNGEVRLDVTVTTTSGGALGQPLHYRFDGPVPVANVLQGVITYDDGKTAVERLIRQ